MRPALRDRIAGHDHRPLRLCEHPGGERERDAITAQTGPDPRRRHQVDVALGLENVAGQRQEYRPGRRRQRRLGGAVDEARQVGKPGDLGGPFDEGPYQRRQVRRENRLGGEIVGVLLAGREQHRRAGLLCIVEHAHGIAEARRDVKVKHRKLAGGLGVAVRHGHQGGLLKAEHVTNIVFDRESVHQRKFGGARVAEHDLDALLLEQLKEGALSRYCRQDGLRVPCSCRGRSRNIA